MREISIQMEQRSSDVSPSNIEFGETDNKRTDPEQTHA